MPIDVVAGRLPTDRKKFGKRGCVLIGKVYVKMGDTVSQSNPVYMDLAGAHVIFIVGKRGSGKSYTMGVVAEGFELLEPEIKNNISVIMIDTMGIYWTMKYGNKKEDTLLEPYGIKPRGMNVKVYVPYSYYDKFRKEGVPVDEPFSIEPRELTPDDWVLAFKIDKFGKEGVLLAKVVLRLQESNLNYTLEDIISVVKKDETSSSEVKGAVINMFEMAKSWGLFNVPGTPIKSVAKGGVVTVLDVSIYATMPGGWAVKSLVVALVSRHMFIERMRVRRKEENSSIQAMENYFSSGRTIDKKSEMPLVWLVIDEAHEFLPFDEKDKSAATEPLVTILREGRQPGVSLILATQQPGKIHTDVMTQSDILLGHRVTANLDTKALSLLSQSYMREGIVDAMDHLPREKGSAVLFDDANERIYPIRIRPRFTWHGGSSPFAVPEKKKNIFD
jgi:DNA helicase HerA-like ATPase